MKIRAGQVIIYTHDLPVFNFAAAERTGIKCISHRLVEPNRQSILVSARALLREIPLQSRPRLENPMGDICLDNFTNIAYS